MGSKNSKKKLDNNTPLLVWIDENVNNKENKKYQNYIKKELKYNILTFKSVNEAIDELLKLEFNKIYIISSGKSYIKYIELFKENLNKFMICPQTIIFTRNKKTKKTYII